MFVKLSNDVERNVTSIVPFQKDCSTGESKLLLKIMCPLEQSEQGFPIASLWEIGIQWGLQKGTVRLKAEQRKQCELLLQQVQYTSLNHKTIISEHCQYFVKYRKRKRNDDNTVMTSVVLLSCVIFQHKYSTSSWNTAFSTRGLQDIVQCNLNSVLSFWSCLQLIYIISYSGAEPTGTSQINNAQWAQFILSDLPDWTSKTERKEVK